MRNLPSDVYVIIFLPTTPPIPEKNVIALIKTLSDLVYLF